MISVQEALRIVLENAPAPEAAELPSTEALGAVLAEDVLSTEEIPSFDRSAMDGYAVRREDTVGAKPDAPRHVRVVGATQAGQAVSEDVAAGRAVEIMTGAPLARGADAVVEQESTAREGADLRILREVRMGENVRGRGEDARPGEKVLARGTVLSPAALGVLATVGRCAVRVYRAPRTAVLTTGNEIVPPETTPPPGSIRNSNARAMAAALASAGAPPAATLHAGDQAGELRERIEAAFALRPDLLLLTGGVSVGRWDLVRDTLQKLDIQPLFWGVAQKPGKPLFAGRRGRTLVLGLPGNPASALVCFYEYAWPAIRKARGFETCTLEEVTARLERPLRHRPGKTDFFRGRLVRDGSGWSVRAEEDQGSHLLGPFARANALIVVGSDQGDLPEGTKVTVHRLPGMQA